MSSRPLLLAALLATAAGAQLLPERGGESIYREGLRLSGEPITAGREGSPPLSGAEAACTNCHRRSGLGETDGNITIPPIAGPYLHHARAKDKNDLDIPYIEGMRTDRDAYTEVALARAIRDGIGVDGAPLNYLMPRYDLSDADLAALTDYLQHMMPAKVPGVTGVELNFATIVTPDADPVKREAVLNVLRQYFADQNSIALAERPRAPAPHRVMSKINRRWQLHVWTLSGPPAAWEEELRRHLAQEPVFAAISGMGGESWGPVHRFCERSALPCLFPNVDLPVVAEHDFYSLYFSRGVLLEAELLAHQIAGDSHGGAAHRVVQIFRAGDVGEPGAQALHAALAGTGPQVVERPLSKAGGGKELAAALDHLGQRDTLVLWLRARDIMELSSLPVRASRVLMSGLMGGLGAAPLPAAWRPVTHMAYPFDLPDKRSVPTDYALGWFALRHIPLTAEQVQVDTYVVCRVLSETLAHMGNSLTREYLVERIEETLDHRIVSGYYPRLSLAPNERFASKGGYIVHFAEASGARVLADIEWLVP